MCGINGYTGQSTGLIGCMNQIIGHRGPDGTAHFSDGHVVLGHDRLAIIDLSERGAQPMKNHDGSMVITYNGELYNYKELKRELTSYPFTSETDTEVILAAYERWGTDCFKRFNGIFALAIWDARRQKLILARDHMGVKPLYYFHDGSTFVFSSEVKAILEYGIRPKLNVTALTLLLHVGNVAGSDTLVSGVQKLPPAHFAVLTGEKLEITEYWNPALENKENFSRENWIKKIRTTVDEVIERQLISDRPIGIALSGGIDSSSVLATAVKHLSGVKTYTTRFASSGLVVDTFNADADIAKRTAAHFGTNHTEILVESASVIKLLEESVWYLDEPTSSATALSRLQLARTASEDVPVLLGGDGGDELFGGYTRYRLNLAMEHFHKMPLWLQKISSTLLPTLKKLEQGIGYGQFMKLYCVEAELVRATLGSVYQTGSLESYFANVLSPKVKLNSSDFLMEIDRRMLPDGSLAHGDKLLMAAGVEGRVPLLDLELIELAQKIPSHYKVSLFDTKVIFKQAMRDRLPEYLFKERKRGWVSPAGVWLREPDVREYVQSVLSAGYYAGTAQLFDWNGIHKVLENFYAKQGSSRSLVWTLVGFQVWARKFKVELDK